MTTQHGKENWKAQYHYRQSHGLCPRCGGSRDRFDRRLCATCREYFAAATALKVSRRRKKGHCPCCGRKPEAPEQTHGMCAECYSDNLKRGARSDLTR